MTTSLNISRSSLTPKINCSFLTPAAILSQIYDPSPFHSFLTLTTFSQDKQVVPHFSPHAIPPHKTCHDCPQTQQAQNTRPVGGRHTEASAKRHWIRDTAKRERVTNL